jgi:hypothetical protein
MNETLKPKRHIKMKPQQTVSNGLITIAVLLLLTLAIRAAETERVSVIQVPGAPKVFNAQSGADGTIHLLFDSDDGPQYVKSSDSGVTFSAPIPV